MLEAQKFIIATYEISWLKCIWRNTLRLIPVFCATAFSTGISPKKIAQCTTFSGGGGGDGDGNDGDDEGDYNAQNSRRYQHHRQKDQPPRKDCPTTRAHVPQP